MDGIRLFCAFYFFQHVSSGHAAHRPLVGIAGGHRISISEAPYIASLVRYTEKLPNNQAKVEICGGSIIHDRYILTAAHCVQGYSYYDIVRVGSSHVYSGGIAYEIEKIIPHKNFSNQVGKTSFTHDIALVKLKKNINFSDTVSKIELADENFKIDPIALVNVTGYGKIGAKGPISRVLRQVSVQIRPIEDCKIYPWVTDNQICVWSIHKGSCKGDSGGPMTLGNVQIGIVSNGLACGYLPSIYSKISYLLPWIMENIKHNE